MPKNYTRRQLDAVRVLADAPFGGWTPSAFAQHFWPGKVFARGNGPWGLGPDASGRHGGRMLTILKKLDLVEFVWGPGDLYYTARLSHAGRVLLVQLKRADGKA